MYGATLALWAAYEDVSQGYQKPPEHDGTWVCDICWRNASYTFERWLSLQMAKEEA